MFAGEKNQVWLKKWIPDWSKDFLLKPILSFDTLLYWIAYLNKHRDFKTKAFLRIFQLQSFHNFNEIFRLRDNST